MVDDFRSKDAWLEEKRHKMYVIWKGIENDWIIKFIVFPTLFLAGKSAGWKENQQIIESYSFKDAWFLDTTSHRIADNWHARVWKEIKTSKISLWTFIPKV